MMFQDELVKIDYALFLSEFESGYVQHETCFVLDDAALSQEYVVSYHSGSENPFWLGKREAPQSYEFKTAKELCEAKVIYQLSLKDRWNSVSIRSIDGVSLKEWIRNVPHQKKPVVFEDDKALYIEATALDGFIDEELCKYCPEYRCYSETYDAYFCPYCDKWLEGQCGDPTCEFCSSRPRNPSLLWLTWKTDTRSVYCADVVFSGSWKPYMYLAEDETLTAGTSVLVPVGKRNETREATIVRTFYRKEEDLPFPKSKMKSIIN